MNPSLVLASAIFAMSSVQIKSQEGSNSTYCEPTYRPFFKVLLGAICTLKTAAMSTVDVIRTPIKGLTTAGKIVLNTVTQTNSKVLNGTVQTLKKGTGTVADAIGQVRIPGLAKVACTGKKVVHAAADLTNAAGQSLLAGTTYVINNTAKGIIGLSDVAADVAEGTIEMVAETGESAADNLEQTMEAGAEIISSADEKLGNVSSWSNFMAEVMASKLEKG